MSADFNVRIEFGPLARTLKEPGAAERITNGAAEAAIEAAGPFVQRALILETPVGATGKARQSVIFEHGLLPGSGLVGYAAPASTYIGFADQGTRPHAAPWAPIAYWAIRKGLNPGMVWWGIRRHGTKAQHFVKRAADTARHPAQVLMAAAVRAHIAGLGR